jgi:hypothetical protein
MDRPSVPPSDTGSFSPLSSMSPTPPPRIRIKTTRSFPYGTALIVLVIIAVCAGALYAFAGAEVKITPTSQTGTVSGNYTAALNGAGDLPYTTLTFTETASTVVPSESTETVSDPAQGTIIISNAQPKAQALITNTRFETPDGLIFRIHSAVTIPAETSTGPGTVSATVFADQPGVAYNVGPTTFTVPGLKNDKAFTLVTAKSTTSMMGGFSGTRAAVSPTTDAMHQASLQTQLAQQLQADLTAKIPAGDVVVPGATMTTYQSLPDTATTTSTVAISEQGTMTAVAFPLSNLAQAIAYKIIGTYSGQPVTLASVNTLSLTPAATSTSFSNALSGGPFLFSLSGTATVIWQVDASKIASAVAGKTRDSAQNILSSFPEIANATLILRPFWDSTFPQDPSKIHIVVATSTPSK